MRCSKQSIFMLLLLISASVTAETTYQTYLPSNNQRPLDINIESPTKPGTYPVIYYVSGVKGLVPTQCQQTLITLIAETGFVFITFSKMQTISTDKVTQQFTTSVAWLQNNLQKQMDKKGFKNIKADLSNQILFSHSAGGQITTQYLVEGCHNVKLQILLDPVDGAGPGAKPQYVITPGQLLSYATPVLVLQAEKDPESIPLFPSCAPAKDSNIRFYNAMSGPKWYLKFKKYGHLDFYNSPCGVLGNLVCPSCLGILPGCNADEYRKNIRDAVVNFYDGILNKDVSALKVITNGKLPLVSAHQNNLNGFQSNGGGFCKKTAAKRVKAAAPPKKSSPNKGTKSSSKKGKQSHSKSEL